MTVMDDMPGRDFWVQEDEHWRRSLDVVLQCIKKSPRTSQVRIVAVTQIQGAMLELGQEMLAVGDGQKPTEVKPIAGEPKIVSQTFRLGKASVAVELDDDEFRLRYRTDSPGGKVYKFRCLADGSTEEKKGWNL